MLKILINAYACSPHKGSEPGMAWNWCVNLAKYCELFIITEGEFKDQIEKTIREIPQGNNMHFFYNPVSDKIRKMCWNQGDWRFYYYYKQWQKKTLKIAEQIIRNHHIDIIHQLNMIGFREPGYLWKLDKPFVWGPIGGLKQYPLAYASGLKQQLFLRIKNTINILQLKYDKRVNNALIRASVLISSIPYSYYAINKYKGLSSYIIPETGTFPKHIDAASNRFNGSKLNLIWVGKFDFRKRIDIAIKSIAKANNPNVILKVFGTGSIYQMEKMRKLVCEQHIEGRVIWEGEKDNQVIQEEMQKADLLFFTSVNEDTSTVVLEAISNHLPVLCFDTCGMSAVIDEKVGNKIALTSPEQSIQDFANFINLYDKNREVLISKSQYCISKVENLSWDNKAKKMVEIYNSIFEKSIIHA